MQQVAGTEWNFLVETEKERERRKKKEKKEITNADLGIPLCSETPHSIPGDPCNVAY